MYALADLINGIFSLLNMGLLIYIILGLLIQFNVVNLHNQLVSIIYKTLSAIFEPVLRLIRKYLPAINGLDLSPIILFFALRFFHTLIIQDILIPMVTR